jgi:hypothetical protein
MLGLGYTRECLLVVKLDVQIFKYTNLMFKSLNFLRNRTHATVSHLHHSLIFLGKAGAYQS